MPITVTRYQLTTDPQGRFPFTLADNTINTTNSSITLIGTGIANYGQFVADDFVWMLENFAGPIAPTATALTGQTWYDTGTQTLRFYDPSVAGGSPAGWHGTLSDAKPLTFTGDVVGSGFGTINLTLATIPTVVPGTYSSVTINAKGQVTAGTNIATGVTSFNGRTGAVTLQAADLTGIGVNSFNGRTGVVSLTSNDVTTALSYAPVSRNGDTMSGALTVSAGDVTTSTGDINAVAGSLEWQGNTVGTNAIGTRTVMTTGPGPSGNDGDIWYQV
jgi:hypothetical protein